MVFQDTGESLRLRDVMHRTGFGKGMCFRLLYTLQALRPRREGREQPLSADRRNPPPEKATASATPRRGRTAPSRAKCRPASCAPPNANDRADRRRQPLSAESRGEKRRAADPRRHRSGDRVPDRRSGGAGIASSITRPVFRSSPSTSRIRARRISARTTTRRACSRDVISRDGRAAVDGRSTNSCCSRSRARARCRAARVRGILAGIREVLPEAVGWHVVSIDGDGQFKTSLERVRRHLRESKAKHVLVGAANDPSALGAARAFQEAGRGPPAPSSGRTPSPMRAPSCVQPRTPFIASVGYFPEKYGDGSDPAGARILGRRPCRRRCS